MHANTIERTHILYGTVDKRTPFAWRRAMPWNQILFLYSFDINNRRVMADTIPIDLANWMADLPTELHTVPLNHLAIPGKISNWL